MPGSKPGALPLGDAPVLVSKIGHPARLRRKRSQPSCDTFSATGPKRPSRWHIPVPILGTGGVGPSRRSGSCPTSTKTVAAEPRHVFRYGPKAPFALAHPCANPRHRWSRVCRRSGSCPTSTKTVAAKLRYVFRYGPKTPFALADSYAQSRARDCSSGSSFPRRRESLAGCPRVILAIATRALAPAGPAAVSGSRRRRSSGATVRTARRAPLRRGRGRRRRRSNRFRCR